MAKAKPDVLPPAPPEPKEKYVCTCGYQDSDSRKFGYHIMTSMRKEPGKHASRGLINTETGEVIRPPAAKRTREQKTALEMASKLKKKQVQEANKLPPVQYTSNPYVAQRLQFVPRVLQVDFDPTLHSAFDCAVNRWGWEPDFGKWLHDWIIYSYQAAGVELQMYLIHETEEERVKREAVVGSDGNDGEEETEED